MVDRHRSPNLPTYEQMIARGCYHQAHGGNDKLDAQLPGHSSNEQKSQTLPLPVKPNGETEENTEEPSVVSIIFPDSENALDFVLNGWDCIKNNYEIEYMEYDKNWSTVLIKFSGRADDFMFDEWEYVRDKFNATDIVCQIISEK